MNDVLEKQTPYGKCPNCDELLKEEEMSEGVCETCREKFIEEKFLSE